MKTLTAAVASAAIASMGAANASVIFTEMFEAPILGSSWDVFDIVGDFLTVDGAGIELHRSGTVVSAYEGGQYIELDSDFQVTPYPGEGSNTGMAAFVGLVAGATYEISYAYQPRTASAGDNGIEVAVGALTDGGPGARSFSESAAVGQADSTTALQSGWEVFTHTFTATSGDNAILFRAFGTENELGGFLDSVTISTMEADAVPAPAGGILLASGLAALFSRRAIRTAN